MITVFTGPMFSGKTEAAYEAGARAKRAGIVVQVVRPMLDSRRGGRAVTNGGRRLEDYGLADTVVDPDRPIVSAVRGNTRVLVLDEAQFFQRRTPADAYRYRYWIVEELVQLVEHRLDRVYVSGLDMDYRARGFGPMPELMAVAGEVRKLKAVCACGREDAMYTRRLVKSDAQILVGDKEYAPQCAACFAKEIP